MSAAAPSEPEAPSNAKVSFSALYALLVALALLGLALIDDAARTGHSWAGTLFWVALLAIFLPAAWRTCSGRPSTSERVQILLILGLGLYVGQILHSPNQFSFHDELVTLRSVRDLAATNRLFAANPIVKAFPLYPGVDLTTLAVNRVSGLHLFASGLLVIAAMRIVTMLALFQVFRLATCSARVAGIAVLVYVCNPNFLFFDAQFSYESFALPLAIATIAIAARALHEPDARGRRALTALGVLTAVAVAPSHHVTSYALTLGLFAWLAVLALRRRDDRARSLAPVALIAIASAVAVGTWLIVVGSSTSDYLSPVLGGATSSTFHLFFGGGSGKAPFQSSGGPSNTLLEQAAGFASVAILLVLLAVGLWRLRARRPPTALQLTLLLLACLYPFTLALRLTQAGAETSNRASEFVFLGLAAVAGTVLLVGLLRFAAMRRRGGRLLLACTLGLLLVGGVVIGQAPSSRLPGRALVEADPRSVDPYDLAAASWARRHLPPHSRIVADRASALLMAAYGRQDPQVGEVAGLHVASLITSPTFGSPQRTILSQDAIRYVVVDRRLSSERPVVGYYVDKGEPHAFSYRAPLSPAAASKFEGQAGLSRIYDNGRVAIYEARTSSDPAPSRLRTVRFG